MTAMLPDLPAVSAKPRATAHSADRRWGNLLFVLPFLAVYLLLLILPLGTGFWISFHDLDVLSGDSTFVGWQNFTRLWHDAIFRGAVGNTFAFVLMTTPVFVALGLLLALALNRQDRTGAALRTVFFGSSVLSVTIVTLVWRLVFMTDKGLLANIMNALGLDPVNPLTSADLALPAIALVTVWWIIGLPMMLFLAALQQIPEEIYEAAIMDNASRPRVFWSITLPSIRRTLGLVTIIEVILQFQLFGQAQLMTLGGPNNASRPIVQFIYEAGFQQWSLGYAAAAAQILFGLMMAGVIIQMWLARRSEAR
jgi:multiple sugar transport system permease protein